MMKMKWIRQNFPCIFILINLLLDIDLAFFILLTDFNKTCRRSTLLLKHIFIDINTIYFLSIINSLLHLKYF